MAGTQEENQACVPHATVLVPETASPCASPQRLLDTKRLIAV